MSEEQDREDIGIIVAAVQQVQGIIKRAEKDGHNSFHKYDYVSEEGLVQLIRDTVIEAGLLLTPIAGDEPQVDHRTGDKGNRTHVVWKQGFHLAHVSGAIWPFEISVMCEGEDNGDKSVWKGLTNAHKHVWLKLLLLPTGEDPEADENTDIQNQGKERPRQQPRNQSLTEGQQHAQPGTELEQWIMEKGPDYVITNADKKQWGIYAQAFKACEIAWGKDHGRDKFSAMNDFQAQWGLSQDVPMCAKDLPDWHKFVAEWPERNKR